MTIDEQHDPPVITLLLSGRLDAVSSPQLEQRAQMLLDAGARRLVLDLDGIHYANSVGLRVLLSVAKRMAAAQGRLIVAGVSPPVREIFELGGLLDIFTICSTRVEAIAAAAHD